MYFRDCEILPTSKMDFIFQKYHLQAIKLLINMYFRDCEILPTMKIMKLKSKITNNH